MNNLRNQELLTRFGDRLKSLRQLKGLTIQALAIEADIEISQVHRIEKGKINPTLTTITALSKGLDISLVELLDY